MDSEVEYMEQFSKTWNCPYCMVDATDDEYPVVDRVSIPGHLVFCHGWQSENLTWQKIFERLSAVGGV